jgi:hypothetical protein
MERTSRLILLAAAGLNLSLAAAAFAQAGGGADQKVAADKARLKADDAQLGTLRAKLASDRDQIKADEAQLARDRASGNTVAARQGLKKEKADRAQLREDRAEFRKAQHQRIKDEEELRHDERLDRKVDRKP